MTSTEYQELVEALERAIVAGKNLHSELEASDAEFDTEDQAVILGALEDITFAEAALSALKLPRDAVTISRQRYERLRFAAGEIDSDPELSTFAGEPQDAFKTMAGPTGPAPPAGVSDNG